jgi:myotubularin-related protein 1/2
MRKGCMRALLDHCHSSHSDALSLCDSCLHSSAFPSYVYHPNAVAHRNTPSFGLSPLAGGSSKVHFNGWQLYDALQDYTRCTLAIDPTFRVVLGNIVNYGLCASYPRVLISPASMSEADLKQIAQYRSQSRLPAVVWIHPITRASLSRCAQPLAGLNRKRSEWDEKLVATLRTINPSNTSVLHIIDARPWKAAVGNTAMGKGFEIIAHYERATLHFANIDNIHAIRNSLEKLMELTNTSDPPTTVQTSGYFSTTLNTDETFLTKLENTLWIHYIRLVLSAAQRIAVAMTEEGASCITHCSDGSVRA